MRKTNHIFRSARNWARANDLNAGPILEASHVWHSICAQDNIIIEIVLIGPLRNLW